MRQLVILALVIAGIVVLTWARPVAPPPADVPALSYVTTAHQRGVVGYRDPAGAISPDGRHFAYSEGRHIRVIPIGGGASWSVPPADGQVRYLEWTSNDAVRALARPPASVRMRDGTEACVAERRLVIPCGGATKALDPDVDVLGPIAFGADRAYFSSPAGNGMVALWSADLKTLKARRLTNFSRDAYAPSVSMDGTVVFKVQSYRTHLADAGIADGVTRQLTTFQAETPSYHPTQPLLAFTYGTWRRVLDDAKYPDIAQEIGVIDVAKGLPHDRPSSVITESDSEDQAMAWSPNGKWIAFHTHREMSDDIWLRPADLSAVALAKANGSAPDTRITFLGRGAEVGWPRWSADGRTVLLDGARKSDGRSVMYVVGVDQDSGTVTSELREVRAEGFDGDITHAEWLGNDAVIAIANEAPGRHAIMTLPLGGGTPRMLHRFATEHDFPGLGISPDGRQVAFVAPAADGYFQIFRKAIAGESSPIQVTSDPSHKTQPAWSPDGGRIAFTVWSYDATFYSFTDR